MESHIQKHVPYVVLLLQALKIWKEKHGGPPKTNDEKRKDFPALVESLMTLGKGVNSDEARAKAYFCFQDPEIDYELEQIFADPKISSSKDFFWIMSAALKKFYEATGTTPVSGTIQDMTSTPEFYLDLQRVYLAKAEADRNQMATYASQILSERDIADPEAWLKTHADEFKVFCKNSNHLEVTRVRSLEDELKDLKVEDDFQWSLHDEEECHLWYILLRCIEEFRDEFGYYAGLVDHNTDSPAEDKERALKEFTWIK